MRFDIITIFPNIFDSYFKETLLGRAQKKKLIEIRIHNLRRWTNDARNTVDDKPFGGGLGMVMRIEPIYKAVHFIQKSPPSLKLRRASKTILFSPRGKKFDQKTAYEFAKLDQLIMICGRYEGVDERVGKYVADEQISIGDYDLMGGELAAMIVVETISRLVPGVIGKSQFLDTHIPKRRGRGGRGFIEYPQYTRPAVFSAKGGPSSGGQKWGVPKVLMSGDHKKIDEWRNKHGKVIEK